MHKSNSTGKEPKTQIHPTQTQIRKTQAPVRARRSRRRRIGPEQGVESEPEQVGDFKWKKNDNVKPKDMPDPGYTIVDDAGDVINWLMKGPGGRYGEPIPKMIEKTGTWEYWTPDPAALKKRYKRKSKSKRMKSKRRKSKRRKSKPL